ncbi:leucine-rich repeat domain-containing protein [Skeletonema marinoi]|uniref:Leucine-rich repeat domain-containing protein n=1 Tax=Skeletonema marinoi TaxID=267567 RepID=A0AAD8XUL1_9STRA|nr:leucine-rich repeat domain-containing protein [Skeletonema marinoi]
MDRHVLDKMIQSFLRSDENDAHEMCQDIKNTVEEYMVLNRAQLSVSERLLAVNEQLLAAQLRLLETNGNNNSAAPMADQLMVAADTTARDSSVAKKNKKAAKKKRNKRNRAAAKKQRSKDVPWLNGGINTHLLMVIIGSFMTLLIMSLIPQSDGSKGASPPSFPPTAFLRHRRVISEGINADTDSLITMEKSSIFSTSSSSSPLPASSALSSSINTCVDTPNWNDADGNGCNYYEENEDRRCPSGGSVVHDGGMGVARDNCCYCKDSSWKDLKESCLRSLEEGEVASCDEAVSSICDATHEVKVLNMPNGDFETVGLYNKCKCDFWILMCEHEGTDIVACDYAAEYCCGDYEYTASEDTFYYLNSPACYCDFQKFEDVKPQTMNVNSEFTDACDQIEDEWLQSHTREDEKKSLEAMYARLGGDNWIDKDGWMTDTDHCEWFGITCEDGYVTRVDLGGNNLVGQFPVYTRDDPIGNYWRTSKYGLANLYKLVHLDLANNNLTGTIEYAPLYNLQELAEFYISRNNLTGEADALVAPNLYQADFGNNTFTSMRRFEKYKYTVQDKLWWYDASNNKIRQDANDLLWHMPPKMEHFIASNNNIRGALPAKWESLNELKKLREFRMASNYISGELPSFEESYTSLQHLDMSYQKKNGLTGQIPEDLWRTQSFITLSLAGNSLTGTITSLVGDLAVMKEFDLSNNRLIGAIPSEVGMLAGKCNICCCFIALT